jgi:hypothetical protein
MKGGGRCTDEMPLPPWETEGAPSVPEAAEGGEVGYLGSVGGHLLLFQSMSIRSMFVRRSLIIVLFKRSAKCLRTALLCDGARENLPRTSCIHEPGWKRGNGEGAGLDDYRRVNRP